MKRRRRVVILALLTCVPRTLSAQEEGTPPSLVAGDVVRFRTTTGESARRALVLEVDATGVLVERASGDEPRSLRLSFGDLASLEVARGRRSQVGEGMKWGALVGGVGALLAVAAKGGLVGACEGGCGVYFMVGGAGGALAGAGLGALTGLAFETDRFEPVKGSGLRVGLRPVRDGLGASLTLNF